jgi:hypothetical protein
MAIKPIASVNGKIVTITGAARGLGAEAGGQVDQQRGHPARQAVSPLSGRDR